MVQQAYDKNSLLKELLELVRQGSLRIPPAVDNQMEELVSLADCKESKGQLCYQDRLWVPDEEDFEWPLSVSSMIVHALGIWVSRKPLEQFDNPTTGPTCSP